MKSLFISLLILGLLLGCGATRQPPTQIQIESADYGSFPENYKELITKHITERLIDPTSPIFSNWKVPTKGWYQYPFSTSGKTYYGYKVCVFVNAKNRMGGYTGQKPYFIIINNDKIIYSDGADYKSGTVGEQEAYNRCIF